MRGLVLSLGALTLVKATTFPDCVSLFTWHPLQRWCSPLTMVTGGKQLLPGLGWRSAWTSQHALLQELPQGYHHNHWRRHPHALRTELCASQVTWNPPSRLSYWLASGDQVHHRRHLIGLLLHHLDRRPPNEHHHNHKGKFMRDPDSHQRPMWWQELERMHELCIWDHLQEETQG